MLDPEGTGGTRFPRDRLTDKFYTKERSNVLYSIHHGDINDNLDYTFSLVLMTKIRDVNPTWPLCDKGELAKKIVVN